MQFDSDSHDTLQLVQLYLKKVASELDVELSLNSRHTRPRANIKAEARYLKN